MQNFLIDIFNMDHIGVICEDELLVFLKLLESEREEDKDKEDKA